MFPCFRVVVFCICVALRLIQFALFFYEFMHRGWESAECGRLDEISMAFMLNSARDGVIHMLGWLGDGYLHMVTKKEINRPHAYSQILLLSASLLVPHSPKSFESLISTCCPHHSSPLLDFAFAYSSTLEPATTFMIHLKFVDSVGRRIIC